MKVYYTHRLRPTYFDIYYVYGAYNVLSYIYVHLLVLILYLIGYIYKLDLKGVSLIHICPR